MYQWKLFSISSSHVIFFSLMMNWKNKVISHYVKIGVKNKHSSPYACSFLLLVFKLYSL